MQGPQSGNGSFRIAEYGASFIARPNEALVYPRKLKVFNCNNVITGSLPDLVVICLVSDADLAGFYHKSLFNFRNFGLNRIKIKHNCTFRPSEGYISNFATGQYITAYST